MSKHDRLYLASNLGRFPRVWCLEEHKHLGETIRRWVVDNPARINRFGQRGEAKMKLGRLELHLDVDVCDGTITQVTVF